MALCKLESRITVPSGGWTVSVQEFTPNAGPVSVTIAGSGNYYLSSTTALLAQVASALTANGTLAGTYACTVDSATGIVTLSATGVTTFNVTWTSTDARDALGFGGNLTGALSYATTKSSPHIWIPNTPRGMGRGSSSSYGAQYQDATVTMSPDGTTKFLGYSTRHADTLRFASLTGQKTLTASESVVNESLQTFWTSMRNGGFVSRFHPDRTVQGTYFEQRWASVNAFEPTPMVEGWTDGAAALWRFEAELLKQV